MFEFKTVARTSSKRSRADRLRSEIKGAECSNRGKIVIEENAWNDCARGIDMELVYPWLWINRVLYMPLE